MLTFETIREIERLERNNKKLQKLPENFLKDLNDYLARKESVKEKTAANLMELDNVRSTIKRIFETREKKIAEMVLYTVKTGYPPENLSADEEKLFYSLVDMIKNYREKFFTELSQERPVVEEKAEVKKPTYRIKKTMPEFVGPDMKLYKLMENDIVTDLPKPLNDLLIKEGIIEKVKD
jgi:DNA replication initiation complex subunit (GINS family)